MIPKAAWLLLPASKACFNCVYEETDFSTFKTPIAPATFQPQP